MEERSWNLIRFRAVDIRHKIFNRILLEVIFYLKRKIKCSLFLSDEHLLLFLPFYIPKKCKYSLVAVLMESHFWILPFKGKLKLYTNVTLRDDIKMRAIYCVDVCGRQKRTSYVTPQGCFVNPNEKELVTHKV